jgi:hypothetical protein
MLLARAYVAHQRDQLLRVAQNALCSHQRREAFGLPTRLSDNDVRELHVYVGMLNEVTRQAGFPYEVEWPATPACLHALVVE